MTTNDEIISKHKWQNREYAKSIKEKMGID